MGRVLINGNGWTLSCSAEIGGLSMVRAVTLIFFKLCCKDTMILIDTILIHITYSILNHCI